MSSKNWLILASHVPAEGGLGGMIRYTVEVTRSLQGREGIELFVHCTPDAVPFFVDGLGIAAENVIGTASGSTVRDSLTEVFALGRTIRRNEIDIVFGSKQLLPRRGHGATRVLAAHDMLPLDRPQDFGPAKRMLLPPMYRQTLRQADLIVCCSEASRRQMASYEPEAAAGTKVVPLAMTDFLRTIEADPVPELVERPYALCVGDLSYRKNVGFLLQIWPEVVARVPSAHLALIGPPGWGRNAPLPALEGLTASGSVSHLGRVGDGALRWAYQNARMTLCPSLLEGFGLPVVESLMLGSPTIISTDPAQVEASEGEASVIPVTEPQRWVDAIVDHFEAPRCGIPSMRDRSWDDVVDELVALVSQTVDRGAGSLTAGTR